MKIIAVVSVVVDATLTALASAVGVATPCDGGCGGTDSGVEVDVSSSSRIGSGKRIDC